MIVVLSEVGSFREAHFASDIGVRHRLFRESISCLHISQVPFFVYHGNMRRCGLLVLRSIIEREYVLVCCRNYVVRRVRTHENYLYSVVSLDSACNVVILELLVY